MLEMRGLLSELIVPLRFSAPVFRVTRRLKLPENRQPQTPALSPFWLSTPRNAAVTWPPRGRSRNAGQARNLPGNLSGINLGFRKKRQPETAGQSDNVRRTGVYPH